MKSDAVCSPLRQRVAAAIAVAAAGCIGAAARASVCPDGQVQLRRRALRLRTEVHGRLQGAHAAAVETKLGCPVNLIITQQLHRRGRGDEGREARRRRVRPARLHLRPHGSRTRSPSPSSATKSGKPVTYTAALWVPADSAIKTVADLKGHTIAFSDPGSTSGQPASRATRIIQAGLEPEQGREDRVRGLALRVAARARRTARSTPARSTASSRRPRPRRSQFDASKFRMIWQSAPIQNDPITVRGEPAGGVQDGGHEGAAEADAARS